MVGYCGCDLDLHGTSRSVTFPIPDFGWSGGHIEDQPIIANIYIDTKQDNKPAPFWVGSVGPGCRVKVTKNNDGGHQVSISYGRKKIVTLTSQGTQNSLEELVCVGLGGDILAKVPGASCDTVVALRALLAELLSVKAEELQMLLPSGQILTEEQDECRVAELMGFA